MLIHSFIDTNSDLPPIVNFDFNSFNKFSFKIEISFSFCNFNSSDKKSTPKISTIPGQIKVFNFICSGYSQ